MTYSSAPKTNASSSNIIQDNQSLVSLAILKVNWDVHKKDYLENFGPIVAESIKLLSSDVISLIELQETIKKHFGLELSQHSLQILLVRARKRGYVTQKNKAYYRNSDVLASTNFREVQQRVLLMYESLIADIRDFAAKTFGMNWTAENADNALQAYLTASGHNLLAAMTLKTAIADHPYAAKSERFIIASFVKHAQEKNSSSFEFLETIVKGNMLATAIFLPDPASADRRFRNTQVFLDTSFIVYALGYAGLPRRDPCVELLNLLYETGAELRCFQHTLEEIRGILIACAYKIGAGAIRDAYGPSIEYFLSEGYTGSDIEYFANRLENDLQVLRVKVVEKPPFIEKFLIDEKALTTSLSDRVGYKNQEALDRDVASTSAIMRFRGTALYFSVEDSRALLVTTNTRLAEVVDECLMANATPGAVAPCITDYNLTNLLWLKKPLRAPNLPKKRLIADCYAATQPDDRLWKKYLDEIDKMNAQGTITSADVYLLRHSLQARSALMEKTLGEEQAFTQGTVPEILEMIRSDIESKARSEYENEVKRRIQVETELAVERLKHEQAKRTLTRRAQKYAAVTVNALAYTILLLLTFSTLYSFPWNMPSLPVNWFKYTLPLVQALFLILGAIHLFRGTALRVYLRQLESCIAKRIELLLNRITDGGPNRPADLH